MNRSTINHDATFAHDKSPTFDASEDLVRRLEGDLNLLHVICMGGRPGGYLFNRGLELKFFRPGAHDNDNYNVLLKRWADVQWIVVSVPIRFRQRVESWANECGMRLADGIPHVFEGRSAMKFPLDSPQAFVLENKPSSIIYDGPSARQMAHSIEMQKVAQIERDHYAWFDQQRQIYWRGRMWQRFDPSVAPPPADAVDAITMGEDRGKLSFWFTREARRQGWTPYPK